MDKKILAIIPARGGSKGIPYKNILDLNGYPLLAYSIAISNLSRYINRVIVSTDDKKIARVALQYGAEVPFLRPKKYALDNSLDIDFVKHALKWLKNHEGYVPDYVIHLRPTTPLRNYRILDEGIKKIMHHPNATSLRSCHVFERSAYKLFKIKKGYIVNFGKEDFAAGEEYYNYPRQKLPITYTPNSYVDVLLPSTVESGSLHGDNILAYITPVVPDIDTYQDIPFLKSCLDLPEFGDLNRELKRLKQYGHPTTEEY
jgi:CMP-N,N'-diacetyllegionaminic acid synthase